MSLSENVRQYARELQKLLLNVILHDNEENALLAIKVLIDHVRGFRIQFSPEVWHHLFAMNCQLCLDH